MVGKSDDAEVEAVVLKFMVAQNRPFSVNDLCTNTKDAYGKTAMQKAVDNLVQDGKIIEKVYGKQKIYLVDQSGLKEINQADSKAFDVKIEDTEKTLKREETTLKELQSKLNAFQNAKSTDELKQQLKEITKEVAELESKHISLSTKTIVMDKEKRKLQKKTREQHMAQWRSRKRKCMDMLDAILESYPGTKKALFEQIGIETDEEALVSLPKD